MKFAVLVFLERFRRAADFQNKNSSFMLSWKKEFGSNILSSILSWCGNYSSLENARNRMRTSAGLLVSTWQVIVWHMKISDRRTLKWSLGKLVRTPENCIEIFIP